MHSFIARRVQSVTSCDYWRRNLVLALVSSIVVAAMLRLSVPVLLLFFPADSMASDLVIAAMGMSSAHFFSACGIAAFGGAANLFHELRLDQTRFTVQNAIGHMFICQFSGVMTYLLTIEWQWSVPYGLAACGLMGWLGNAGIVMLSDIVTGRMRQPK